MTIAMRSLLYIDTHLLDLAQLLSLDRLLCRTHHRRQTRLHLLLRLSHRLQWVQHPHVRVRVEQLVEVVLPVYQLQLEELQLVPRTLQLLLPLLQQRLQLLDETQVLLPRWPVVEQSLQLVVLLLHQ